MGLSPVPASELSPCPCRPKVTNNNSKQPVAGASQFQDSARTGAPAVLPEKSRALSFADGRRGVQERNRVSNGFHSFIRLSFQAGPQFLQAVAVPARGRIG